MNIYHSANECPDILPANSIVNADCFDVFDKVADASIDMILCDLPYGTTKNKWDSILCLDTLWGHYERVIKPNGAIVLTAQTPFDKILGASNIKLLKYEYIWNKQRATGHLNSKFAPMKQHENILVFSKASASFVKDKSKAMCFNPQFSTGKPYKSFSKNNSSSNYDLRHQKNNILTINNGNYYPVSILSFLADNGLHPTQKPIALFKYLIKTYTNAGALVLDNCAGSGTTGAACIELGREFILIEKESGYFNDTVIPRLQSTIATQNSKLFNE